MRVITTGISVMKVCLSMLHMLHNVILTSYCTRMII